MLQPDTTPSAARCSPAHLQAHGALPRVRGLLPAPYHHSALPGWQQAPGGTGHSGRVRLQRSVSSVRRVAFHHGTGSSKRPIPSQRPAYSDTLPAGISQCQEEAAAAGQSLLLNK